MCRMLRRVGSEPWSLEKGLERVNTNVIIRLLLRRPRALCRRYMSAIPRLQT